MSMDPERPRKMADAMEAFAAECAAEDLWPTAAAQLRHTAEHLRSLADRLPPAPEPPVPTDDVRAAAEKLRRWQRECKGVPYMAYGNAATVVENLLKNSR